MALQQNYSVAGAQMLGNQATTLLIRPIQGQQGMLGNIQMSTSAQLKGKVDGQGNYQVVKVVILALLFCTLT